jgi:hypothetical protein
MAQKKWTATSRNIAKMVGKQQGSRESITPPALLSQSGGDEGTR